jgi:hypothetical protein
MDIRECRVTATGANSINDVTHSGDQLEFLSPPLVSNRMRFASKSSPPLRCLVAAHAARLLVLFSASRSACCSHLADHKGPVMEAIQCSSKTSKSPNDYQHTVELSVYLL